MQHSKYALPSLAAITMSLLSANSAAGITAPVTLDFSQISAAVYGAANLSPLADGGCTGISNCYFEDGMAIGVVDDPLGYGEHLHRSGSNNFQLQYHADSSGIYIRAVDGSAFSLTQMRFNAAFDEMYNSGYDPIDNPLIAGDLWEILGFNTAVNPDLSAGDGTNYATRVAYQQVANGFNGILAMDSAFHNINAFWIHFSGYPRIPLGAHFGMKVDNIQLAAPVPLPPAAWLMGSSLFALLSFKRPRSAM